MFSRVTTSKPHVSVSVTLRGPPVSSVPWRPSSLRDTDRRQQEGGHVRPPSDPEGGPVTTQVRCLTWVRGPSPNLVSRTVLTGSGLGCLNKFLWQSLPWSVLPSEHSFLSRVGQSQAIQTAKWFHEENEGDRETNTREVRKSTAPRDLKWNYVVKNKNTVSQCLRLNMIKYVVFSIISMCNE